MKPTLHSALLALVLLAATACGNWPAPAPIVTPPPRPGPGASPVGGTPIGRGGRVTIGAVGEPRSLNPAFGQTPAVAALLRPVVEGLIDFDADGRPRPWLAEEVPTRANGGLSEDGRVVTFRLRQGVAWEDGKPFTTRDLLFTYAAYRNPENPFVDEAVAAYRDLDAVDALDSYTLRLAYGRPNPAYLRAFATVFPAHLFNERTRLVDHPYNRAPFGAGPFRVREWVVGDHLTLVRSPSYREAGKPYLDELVFRFFPDQDTAAEALRAGLLDLLLDPAGTGLTARTPLRGLAPHPRAPATWNAAVWRRE